MTKRTLKTAEPTMVPKPTSDLERKTPMMEVMSSGAEPPAAIHVAPATSSFSPCISQIASSDASKKASHTIARPWNIQKTTTKMKMVACTFWSGLVGS